jgi:hypothetical protein
VAAVKRYNVLNALYVQFLGDSSKRFGFGYFYKVAYVNYGSVGALRACQTAKPYTY